MITISEHGSEVVSHLRGLLTLHRVLADLLHLLHVLEADALRVLAAWRRGQELGGHGGGLAHFVHHFDAVADLLRVLNWHLLRS